ncbi:MAG: hypothetical protein V4541_02020 [Bacteroidota bacterium]
MKKQKILLLALLSFLTLTISCQKEQINEPSITSSSKNKSGKQLTSVAEKQVIKERFNLNAKYLKLDESSILNLMIVRSKEGKLRWSYIVSFRPSDGKKQARLSEGTLGNILNNKHVELIV